MEIIKKIAVIGGTGKSGTYLVQELVDQGIPIKVLIRNRERFPVQSPLVEVVTGDVTVYEDLQALIAGTQAVISALGLGVPASEPTIFSQATKNIIRAMQQYQVCRYIVLTGLQVDAPWDKKGLQTKAATDWMYANFPRSTADRQREYQLLSASPIDWTLVRLPLIAQTNGRHKVKTSLEDCPGDQISAADLASFLVEQLTDNTYIKKSPFIANI
ncbi:NAD(P)H-binding protein [Adhaeribacter swui]|uniref:NAD(P)H-binding protein n=1 Tax=Adhaeribacter swui TaxID=2086471 RepID=A0A7G7G7G0_9BACT|nr:NAD(P)H-binding protein [Adhaeribacter swui]QNF33094.1 NAD(P)H-binding protein [Adhaeribacter swui]